MNDSSWHDELEYLSAEEPSYTEEETVLLKAVYPVVYDFVAHSPSRRLSDMKGANLTLFCCKVGDELDKRYFLTLSRSRALRRILPPEDLLESLADKAMALLPKVSALIKGCDCDDKPELFEAERNLRTIIRAFYTRKAA